MSVTQEQISQLKKAIPSLTENEPLASHTNFRIGGPARTYVVAPTADEVVHTITAANEAGVPWEIMGGGSNILVSDKGVDGLVIQAAMRDLRIAGDTVTCGAGTIVALAARKAAEAGLTGFEWAVTVPGTIGGAIFGNAGCYGGEMKDVVASVDAYRIADGVRVSLTNAECRFGYRDSLFKHERHVILGCSLTLVPGDATAALAKIDATIAKRKEEQPFAKACAGCLFKNVEFTDEKEIEKLREEMDVPQAFIDKKQIPAGWLVERAGMKGYRLGQIEVSDKHANFILNLGGGTADEVAQVISIIQMKVRDQFGLPLKTEVQFMGF